MHRDHQRNAVITNGTRVVRPDQMSVHRIGSEAGSEPRECLAPRGRTIRNAGKIAEQPRLGKRLAIRRTKRGNERGVAEEIQLLRKIECDALCAANLNAGHQLHNAHRWLMVNVELGEVDGAKARVPNDRLGR